LNLLLAKRMNITYLLFLNLFLWSLLHLSINRLISGERGRKRPVRNSDSSLPVFL
jgi:hypothetical protein